LVPTLRPADALDQASLAQREKNLVKKVIVDRLALVNITALNRPRSVVLSRSNSARMP
jgi:hypothetical protein